MHDPDQNKEHGLEIGALFSCVLVGLGLYPLLDDGGANLLLIKLGFALSIIAVFKPVLLAPLYRYWMKFAEILNKVVSPIVLGIMFSVIFVPVSMGLRLLKKDLLRTNKSNCERDTLWRDRNKDIPFDMTKQF